MFVQRTIRRIDIRACSDGTFLFGLERCNYVVQEWYPVVSNHRFELVIPLEWNGRLVDDRLGGKLECLLSNKCIALICVLDVQSHQRN